MVLKIQDQNDFPSVNVPASIFGAVSCNYVEFESALLAIQHQLISLISYAFSKGARVVLYNDGDENIQEM